jgi:hypothetical protein
MHFFVGRRLTMAIDLETHKALDINNLPLPPGFKIIRIEAEDYTDSTGEPSLRVLVVLDESVNVEHVSGEAVGDFTSALRERLRQHGSTEFAYITFAKPSELAETDEE